MAERRAQLWGTSEMHPALLALSESLEQDGPLAEADLVASAAYARALGRAGVLNAEEATRLATVLEELRRDYVAGRWVPSGAEDIHAAIEAEVTRRAGELGERLHTGRSRNDQVVTAFRLAVMQRCDAL